MKNESIARETATATATGMGAGFSEIEVCERAREAFLLAHPRLPRLAHEAVRAGRLDFLMASARQALRDTDKPVDLMALDARTAWALNRHRKALERMDAASRTTAAAVAITALRVGQRIHGSDARPCGAPGLFGVAAIIAAISLFFT